jgi:hypothetical protein
MAEIQPVLHLSPVKQRIFEAVRARPGISSRELRDVVWADHLNGGPEDPKNLHVHISQMNHQLVAHGLRIRGSRRDGYRLISHDTQHARSEGAASAEEA